MRQCTKCGEIKPLDDFHKRADRPDKYRSVCKSCRKNADAKYHQDNKEARLAKQSQYDAARIKAARDFIYGYLKEHPCVDCGETDIVVLEFDHVRGKKVMNIGTMVIKHRPLSIIQDEVDKCDVRCANCHRRATAQRGSWAILKY